MPATSVPRFIPPGEGAVLHGPGGDLSVPKLAAADTCGLLSLTEYTAMPGVGPPLHRHEREDETFYIIEGEVTFVVAGKEIVARPGAVVYGPRGVPHTFKNRSREPAKMLLLVTPPANFETFYACIGAPGPDGSPPGNAAVIERITRESARFGIDILGPNPL